MPQPPDPLQCGLCLSRHKDPRLLDCFHSFCRECLERYIHKKKAKVSFPCPICEWDITIPKAGLAGLPENYYTRAIHASAAFSTLSPCDICKNDTQSTARCLECESNLCTACTNRHLANDNGRDHHIVQLTKPEAKKETKVIHKSYCEKHKNEETKFYCMLCEIPVCKECVAKVSDHKGHKYKNITEGANEKRDKVNPIIQSMHEYLPCLKDYLNEINSCKTLLGDYTTETVTEIKNRMKFLQDEIEKMGNHLIEEVEKKNKNESERIEKHIEIIESTIRNVSTINSSAEEVINLANDSEVVMMCEKLHNRFRRVDKEIPSSGLKTCISSNFHEGDLQGTNLTEMFGYCDETDIKMPVLPAPWGLRIALSFDVQLLFSFKVSDTMDTVHAIAPLSENEAWVCCGWGTSQMSLFNRDGQKKQTLTLDVQVDDICLISGGELLVSSYDGKKIVKLNKDLKQSDFVSLNWYPGGMTFTKKKEILVCAVDSYVTTRSRASRRMVIRINEKGEILDQIEDNGFHEIFCAPYRLYENIIGDICVSDRQENNVRVTAFNLEGTIKNTYTGPKDILLKKPFNPFGVVCDKNGHVMVSDWSNSAIHLMDISGQFLGFLLTDKDGIRGPNALALDKDGCLWVGDTKSTVWVFKYSRKSES